MLAQYTNGNVLTIKKMLRHKKVENTMKYIHTMQFKDKDFEIATATTEEEVKQLGQAGSLNTMKCGVSTSTVSQKVGGLQVK